MLRSRLLVTSLLLAVGLAAQAAPVTYKLDPGHTMVVASWSHFGFSHPVATFGEVEGTLVYDAANVSASRVDVTMPVSGLDAVSDKLTAHLQSKDFFDMANHPVATFKSTKVESAGDNKLKVAGDLTIRGTTRPVVLDVTLNKATDAEGRAKLGFDATGTIKRSEFGMTMGLPNVSDEVQLRITTEANTPKPEGAEKQ
jgi:polyisoprenoid-binding protein YceI